MLHVLCLLMFLRLFANTLHYNYMQYPLLLSMALIYYSFYVLSSLHHVQLLRMVKLNGRNTWHGAFVILVSELYQHLMANDVRGM